MTTNHTGTAEVLLDEQVRFLAGWLPTAPARVLDAGCGDGALALALSRAGYDVVAVDVDPAAVAATIATTAGLGVAAVEADVTDLDIGDVNTGDVDGGGFDAVVFSLSLHHVERLGRAVTSAHALLNPGGTLVVDEFAWDSADRATASWFYDAGAVLASTGLLAVDHLAAPVPDPYTSWRRRHRDDHGFNPGEAMIAAIHEQFDIETVVRAPYLYRYLGGWLDPGAAGAAALGTLRRVEDLRISDRSVVPVGLRLLARTR